MAANNAFLNGRWMPSTSEVTYQNFQHFEKAMEHSHKMSEYESQGQHLRQLAKCGPTSPTFTPQPTGDSDSRLQHVYETDPDAIIFRLARNRPALDSLRRTRKMRYRRNLKFLAESFPLANERAFKADLAKKETEAKQGLSSTEILAQKELAKQKSAEKTVEELKYLREMKAARMKAKAGERLKAKAVKDDAMEKKIEKPTSVTPQKTVAKKPQKTTSREKATSVGAKKTPKKVRPQSTYVGTAKDAEKIAALQNAEKDAAVAAAAAAERAKTYITVRNIFQKTPSRETEKDAPKRTRKTAPKSTQEDAPERTGSTAGKAPPKKCLRDVIRPKYSRTTLLEW